MNNKQIDRCITIMLAIVVYGSIIMSWLQNVQPIAAIVLS